MSGKRPIWLDVARLVERACVGSLTGIDRVELAYAEALTAMAPERTRFVMLGRASSRLVTLPHDAVLRFIDCIRRAWQNGHPLDCRREGLRLLMRAAIAPSARGASPIYLLVSHRHLHREAALSAALRRAGAAFVPLIHDVIPLEFPEYARPGEAERHLRRMTTVARLADGVVANSPATARALAAYLPDTLPVHVAPLGVPPAVADVSPETSDRAYFLCVGTIEPRKNHLMLLHLWRRLIALHGNATPRLILVGRRGWENENVLDLLDRCPSLKGHVVELGAVPDSRLAALLRGARALLMPSFAEGFGLPVAEALAHGVPVLCSDLPALREAGQAVPEYLDPLDSHAWHEAVMHYAADVAPRRDAQRARLGSWHCASQQEHVASVVDFIDTCTARVSWGSTRAAHGVVLPPRLRNAGPISVSA
jgi:glycosyltransferase involved in cell wall biosynthesis